MARMSKFFPTHELDNYYQGETPEEAQELRWICISLLPLPIRKLLMGNEYVILCPPDNAEAHNE